MWQGSEILFHVAVGNKRLEEDQSATAYNLITVNVIYLIKTSIALTMYQALFRADYKYYFIKFST